MIGQKFRITDAGWRDDRHVAYFCYVLETDEKTFELEETIAFPASISDTFESESLLRALHIALAMSYYKSFIPPIIEHPYQLSDEEAGFWNKVYHHGLGEFLYKNQLSSSKLATFSAQKGESVQNKTKISDWSDAAILGIGGGKDSIVAGELLKEARTPVRGFVLATGEILGQTQAVADKMHVDLSAIKRNVDPQIIAMNQLEGAYNGHIPISVIFGLVGAMVAVSQRSQYVVVANEASASIPQTSWEGENINHQWSKSIEYEQLFQEYLKQYISPEIQYFSAVRPLTSVAIARIFSNYPQYFEVFTSDNSVLKIVPEKREHPRWSVHSTKSLSSFILLAPWIGRDDLERVFGRNFLDETDLTDLFTALLGHNGQTVLDCVGTPEELRSSMANIIDRGTFTDSALVTYTISKQLLHAEPELQSFMQLHEHLIPEVIAPTLLALMEQHL